MKLDPNFVNETKPEWRRACFQFTAAGKRLSGVIYVNRTIAPGADLMDEARKAAKVAAKRAGADEVTLHRVQAPRR